MLEVRISSTFPKLGESQPYQNQKVQNLQRERFRSRSGFLPTLMPKHAADIDPRTRIHNGAKRVGTWNVGLKDLLDMQLKRLTLKGLEFEGNLWFLSLEILSHGRAHT